MDDEREKRAPGRVPAEDGYMTRDLRPAPRDPAPRQEKEAAQWRK